MCCHIANRTIGEWLVGLLEDINYFGTILPRIPKKIEDSIKVKVRCVLCARDDTLACLA